MKKWTKLLALPATLALLAACGDEGTQDTTEEPATEEPATEEDTATQDDTATEEPAQTEETTDDAATEDQEASEEEIEVTMINSDEEESGTATFTETDEGVNLSYEFMNLPEGEFGFHIHETGQATAPDFEDANSHWNPTDVEHGTESETGPHLGDLPNLTVDESGEVSGEEVIEDATLTEDPEEGQQSLHNDGQGTALIVHTEADDYESQPTGDAGDRQLGGVIIESEEENGGEEESQ